MGYIEDKAKAAQYDAANAQNARVAQEVANMTAAQLAVENAYLKQGLASQMAPRYNVNPQNFANVPGQEIAGYQMPSDGGVGPSSYRRPAVVPQEQGLAAKIMQYLGGK